MLKDYIRGSKNAEVENPNEVVGQKKVAKELFLHVTKTVFVCVVKSESVGI